MGWRYFDGITDEELTPLWLWEDRIGERLVLHQEFWLACGILTAEHDAAPYYGTVVEDDELDTMLGHLDALSLPANFYHAHADRWFGPQKAVHGRLRDQRSVRGG